MLFKFIFFVQYLIIIKVDLIVLVYTCWPCESNNVNNTYYHAKQMIMFINTVNLHLCIWLLSENSKGSSIIIDIFTSVQNVRWGEGVNFGHSEKYAFQKTKNVDPKYSLFGKTNSVFQLYLIRGLQKWIFYSVIYHRGVPLDGSTKYW